MNTKIKKSCELARKLLDQINDYCGQYTGVDGKDVVSELNKYIATHEIKHN